MSKKFSINPDSKKFIVQNNTGTTSKNILGDIVKKVNTDHLIVDSENEQLLVLDEKNRKLTIHKGNLSHRIKSFGGREYTHFLVDFSEFIKIENLTCELLNAQQGIETKLGISFELSFIKGKALDALRFFKNDPSSSYRELEKSIINWTRSFSIQNPNLSIDFFALENQYRSYLVHQLEQNGIRIRNVQFHPVYSQMSEDFPPPHITIVHKTKCEIQDDYIEVKSKIVLNLINKRAYSSKYINDPELWIKEKTDAIIQNELINKSFKDIIDEFDFGLKENIIHELESIFNEIGYSVEHIISIPSEEIAEFLSGFTFSLGENDTFETSQTEIKVRINATIEAKGTTLSGIDRKYIKPRKSIIAEVKKQTVETIATQLRLTDPQVYYKEFHVISDVIKREVKNVLLENFKLDPTDFKFSFGPLQTDLMERFDWLFAERGTFVIESNSKDLFYELTFGVSAVDDWYVFQKNHLKYHDNTFLEYQDMGKYLKNSIELDIKRLTSDQVDYFDSRSLDDLIIRLFVKASTIIKEEFGFQLKQPQIRRIRKEGDRNILFDAYRKKREQIERELANAIMSEDKKLIEKLKLQAKQLRNQIQGTLDSKTNLLDIGNVFRDKKNISEEEGD